MQTLFITAFTVCLPAASWSRPSTATGISGSMMGLAPQSIKVRFWQGLTKLDQSIKVRYWKGLTQSDQSIKVRS